MPYTKENPPERIKGLPEHAQTIWISAFNSAWGQYEGDEGKCNAVAWSAVEKAGYKKGEDGKWIKEEIELLETQFSDRPWSEVDKSKLPKECFLIVGDPDLKSTWKLPYKDENGVVNKGALRAILAVMGGARGGVSGGVPEEVKKKVERLAKEAGIGELAKEEIIDRGDKPLEKIKVKEATALEGEEVKPHVFRVELMNLEEPNVSKKGWSENDKYYSDRALESLAKLMENKRSMATGHHDGEHLRELGGILKNVRKIPGQKIIEADYKILHQNPEWLKKIITEQTNSPGANLTTLSIVAKGSGFKGERGGKTGEIIENIHKAISCDIVFDAAAGGQFKSLLESKRRKKMEEITIEELKEERPDLVEKILQENKKKISDLENENKDLKAKEEIGKSKIVAERLIKESKLTEGQAIGLLEVMLGKDETGMKEEIDKRKKFLMAIAPEIKVTNLSEKDGSLIVKPLTEAEKAVIKQLGITEEKFRESRGEKVTKKE